jgi:C4-dicarboxylate-specific signal transduction histidine kinase
MQSELTRVARLMTMGQMAASIAHEINQPLAAIVTNGRAGLRWLAKVEPNLDEARAALDGVVKDGHRASDVIGSIRELFRKDEHGKTPLDINKLIREVLGFLQGELSKERVSVHTELISELPNVLANQVQLQLVLRNLIMNAIEAMSSVRDRERVLHVRSEISEPRGVLVMVADSGTGIDQESMNRIFDAFFSTKSHGMGVGLSICRSIVEAHGGQLSATSARPRGSVFRIFFPGFEES